MSNHQPEQPGTDQVRGRETINRRTITYIFCRAMDSKRSVMDGKDDTEKECIQIKKKQNKTNENMTTNLSTIYRTNMHVCTSQVKPSAFHYWLVTRNTWRRQPVSTPFFVIECSTVHSKYSCASHKQNITLPSFCFCPTESLTFQRSLQGLQAIEQELMCTGIHHYSLLLGNRVKKNR